jgi:acetyl esterase/lipase
MSHVTPSDLITRRVCLQLGGMETVVVRRDVEYGSRDGVRLTMDLYYPPQGQASERSPAVIIVAGYSGALEPRPVDRAYKDLGWTVSMAQLIAVSGMVAIVYTNRDPVGDLHALLADLREHAASLLVDDTRVGVLAVSGNVPTALAAVTRDMSRPPACAVFGYGYMLDLDGATDVAEAAARWRFANPCAGRTLSDLRPDVPLLVARAGKDQFAGLNASIDAFVSHAMAANLPLTVINHPDGPHAFDLFDDSPASRAIVRAWLGFRQQHLLAPVGAGDQGAS